MTPEEYKWTINIVKDRHYQFKLSFEQAEKVYQFEKEKDLYSDEHYFSVWEENDYMLDNFQKILDEKQFKKFKRWQNDNIKRYEQHLIDTDKDELRYIDYYTELITFYEQKFIPEFYKEKFLTAAVTLSIHKPKIEFLKSEYKKCLDSLKVGYISSHYRHSKLFKPNALRLTLLRHKVYCIVPNYSILKSKMDDPTKATAQFLLDKFHYIPERYDAFFKQIQNEKSEFVKEIQSKYIGESKGWHMTITETDEQQKENLIMGVILLEKDKYGC